MSDVLDILKKYENPCQLDANQDKMYCVRFYMMAVEGKYPIERVKQMAGSAPMEEYLLPEDYENWKRLISKA